MGLLTDDMTKLCDEIVALRKGREHLNVALAHGSTDRRNSMREMCAGFTRARAEMARETNGARRAFVNAVQQGVQRHCGELRADLDGVRRAWTGRAP